MKMEQEFEQLAEHMYKRQYQLSGGGWKTIYYARFVCRSQGKAASFFARLRSSDGKGGTHCP